MTKEGTGNTLKEGVHGFANDLHVEKGSYLQTIPFVYIG